MSANERYLSFLQDIINDYNDSFHRTIKMTPRSVNKTNEKRILKNSYHDNKRRLGKPKFKIGQEVRISRYKHIFSRGWESNFSNEIFKVSSINKKHPVTYILTDSKNESIRGSFYEQEMTTVKNPGVLLVEKILKRQKDWLLIKYQGLDDSHNSWVHKKDMFKPQSRKNLLKNKKK